MHRNYGAAIAKETQEEQKATLQNIKAQLDTQIQELTNNLQKLEQNKSYQSLQKHLFLG